MSACYDLEFCQFLSQVYRFLILLWGFNSRSNGHFCSISVKLLKRWIFSTVAYVLWNSFFEAVNKVELILDSVGLSTPFYIASIHRYPHAAFSAPFTGFKIYERLFFVVCIF